MGSVFAARDDDENSLHVSSWLLQCGLDAQAIEHGVELSYSVKMVKKATRGIPSTRVLGFWEYNSKHLQTSYESRLCALWRH